MRIFLTGASGLIGSRLASELVRDGHDVRAVSRKQQPARSGTGGGIEWIGSSATSPLAQPRRSSGERGLGAFEPIHVPRRVQRPRLPYTFGKRPVRRTQYGPGPNPGPGKAIASTAIG